MTLTSARQTVRIAGFVGITTAMLSLYTARDAVTPDPDRDALRDRMVKQWAGMILRLFTIQVTREGALPVGTRGRLIVANHRSAIDVGLLLNTFGGHMVSRADLSKWPLIGIGARKIGTVFVDRSSTVSGATTIRTMRSLLGAGQTVIVFPEGTTFPDDEVRPFHPGGFTAALRTGAEILPVGIAYERGSDVAFFGETFMSHLARTAGSKSARVAVQVGTPIEVAANARSAELAATARVAVQELVAGARARCS